MEEESIDRLELRELVDAYARALDRRDPAAVAALFVEDGRLVTTFPPGSEEVPLVRTGRAAIADALGRGLSRYHATTHVIANHVVDLRPSPDSNTVNGETSCLAHHVYQGPGARRILVMALRYHDSYVRATHEPRHWRFAERRLVLEWSEDRPMGAERGAP